MGKREGRAPAWLGPAAVALGALVLGASALLFASLTGSYDTLDLSDRRDMRTVASGIIVGAALVAYGVLEIAGRRRGASGGEACPGAPAGPARVRPEARPQPESRPQPEPSPRPEPRPAPSATPSPRPGGVSALDQVLPRAENVLSTLAYLVRETPEAFGDDQLELVRRTCSGESGPRLSARKLARNGRWWLASEDPWPSREDLDRTLAVEAALNLGADAARAAWPEDVSSTDERVGALLAAVADASPVEHLGSRFVTDLSAGADPDGEWVSRLAFADALENLPTPFRTEVSFRLCLDEAVLVAEAHVPRPGAFSFLPAEGRVDAGRAYAYDLALLIGRTALEAVPRVRRVVVNCGEFGGDEVVLSLELSRSTLGRMAAAERDRGIPSPGASLRVAPREDGWLGEVEPVVSLDDESLCPSGRYRAVELDGAPAPESLARACGVSRVCDLGVEEDAPRLEAWGRVAGHLGGTTEDLVSELVSLRGRTQDETVADACGRTARSLVSGALDASDAEGVMEVFVAGTPLEAAVSRSRSALSARDGEGADPDDLELALAALERELEAVDARCRDDEGTVWRSFGSRAERVAYNLGLADGRVVRLAPEACYQAHMASARILLELARPAEALAHAERACELGPLRPPAQIVRADCLVALSRLDEAARLLSDACARCACASDAGLYLYRLASVECRLGLEVAALACYRRSIELGGPMVAAARSEYGRLAGAAHETLAARRINPSAFSGEAVVRELRAAGLPEVSADAMLSRLAAATGACVDAGLFRPARELVACVAELRRDDALMDVADSLERC